MSHDVEKGLAIVDWFYVLLYMYFGLLIAFIFIALFFNWWVEFLILLPLGDTFHTLQATGKA
jgi:hypothetical protein